MTQTLDGEWPAQWLRGALPLCVLSVIRVEGPIHGYGITRALEAAGLGTIGGGTLYPLLARLERTGQVTTVWITGEGGPAKKQYEITDDGLTALQHDSEQWVAFAQLTSSILQLDKEQSS